MRPARRWRTASSPTSMPPSRKPCSIRSRTSRTPSSFARCALPRFVTAAVVVAMLYLVAQFRNVTDCVLATLPAVFGLVCLLAFMRLSGMKLNMINLIAFPLLVGIDVDYGIFLTTALRRRALRGLSAGELLDRLHPAAAAVPLCAAATSLGFGSPIFTAIPAVQSLGMAVLVGV